ncbi:interleukin-1 receptor-like 1 isoform X2 [Gambusia affinis]|uniref:interleukin-1 receptor-like 1 isoform X2 n=1 Tax=Gambusia affinis TaxID=33528 RepID=UPI001CDCA962|nr:interleukin-1 receptor-like 1 isoform X2 [Gambusia affinis]
MEANVLLTLLPFLTGVFSLRPKTIYTRAGEMVVLRCPQKTYPNTNILWTNQTRQGMNLTSILSTQSADLSQMDVLLHGHNLVILRASLSHQGNYSCSVRNASRRFWFSLIVYEPQSREYEERNRYSTTCYTQESCTLYCPAANIPAHDTPDITGRGITWHKEGETVSTPNDFPSAVERDGGIYKCIRSFLYDGQIYNMSFSVMLEVQKSKYGKSEIISPQQNDVFHIDLGSTLVIDCKAVAYSDYDVVFWLSEGSFVDTDESLPVFYNYSSTKYIDEVNMTASLVFKDVSEEDLLKKYTCKLESDHQQSSFITVSLAERPQPSHVMLTVCSVCVVVSMVVIVVVYVKFKIDVTLFLRDKVGFKDCRSSTSDEKSYDAFLMCYKSVTDGGLNEEDRKCLASTLEDEFGYSICLYDRDVLPGQAVADAVLDCIEQSRAVVLVPSFPDPEPGSAVLSAIHTSLVERKTRLIFINTEQAEASTSGSFPEALQLLSKAGNSVTWKGRPPSTSFWKQLRYHLPAPQQTPKMQLLSHGC